MSKQPIEIISLAGFVTLKIVRVKIDFPFDDFAYVYYTRKAPFLSQWEKLLEADEMDTAIVQGLKGSFSEAEPLESRLLLCNYDFFKAQTFLNRGYKGKLVLNCYPALQGNWRLLDNHRSSGGQPIFGQEKEVDIVFNSKENPFELGFPSTVYMELQNDNFVKLREIFPLPLEIGGF